MKTKKSKKKFENQMPVVVFELPIRSLFWPRRSGLFCRLRTQRTSQKSILNKPQFTTQSVTHFEHRIVKGNSSTRIVSFFLFEILLGIDFKRIDNTFEMNKNKIIPRYSPPKRDPPKSVADVIRRPWFFVLILC